MYSFIVKKVVDFVQEASERRKPMLGDMYGCINMESAELHNSACWSFPSFLMSNILYCIGEGKVRAWMCVCV